MEDQRASTWDLFLIRFAPREGWSRGIREFNRLKRSSIRSPHRSQLGGLRLEHSASRSESFLEVHHY